ncbi:hypothetical protein VINI7043_13716 [Vibrio nigripulchritudo ATCC 27043]|uniref:SLATT domain-containing protein n=1 Tax=Vibrio nigripulchritudo TaxID=28173 RepID=UPI00021C14B8|nr:SLATT domain-containing protein [Vibrio nigripulchritudo]EGU59413.1 hypothetical protein VINI7043_13716 [Vibrio nigripulchritudo ATCC 27043]
MAKSLSEGQVATLVKWRARCKRAQLAHSYTAISYGRYHLLLGVVLILLTTASSVLIFASHVQPVWLSPVIGTSAALFAYLQTFLRLSEKADTHRQVARRYGALKKRIEYVVDFRSPIKDLGTQIDAIRQKEDEIASDAPHALSHRWSKAKKETHTENEAARLLTRL